MPSPLRVSLRPALSRRRRPTRSRSVTLIAMGVVGLAGLPVVMSVASQPRTVHARMTIASAIATPTSTPAVSIEDARLALASVYPVFNRDRQARDHVKVPRGFSDSITTDLSYARLAANTGRLALFALPAVMHGKVALCMIETRNGRAVGTGCGVFEADRAVSTLYSSRTSHRNGPIYSVLLPGGASEARVRLRSGRNVAVSIDEAGSVFQLRGVRYLIWKDRAGATHRTRFGV